MEPLSDDRRVYYDKLKREITEDIGQALTALQRAGEKLLIIRDRRLYREEFETFELFCKATLGHTRAYANRLIIGFELLQDLAAQGEVVLPDNERVARALSKYPRSDQLMIWKRAKQIAGRGKPTYKTIHSAGREIVVSREVQKVWIGEYKGQLRSALKTLKAGVDFSKFGRQSMEEICTLFRDMEPAIFEQAGHVMERLKEIEKSERQKPE
jgi:hypothetical protein